MRFCFFFCFFAQDEPPASMPFHNSSFARGRAVSVSKFLDASGHNVATSGRQRPCPGLYREDHETCDPTTCSRNVESSPEEFVIIRVILSGQDSLGLRVTSCGEGWRQNPCNSAPLDCQLPRMLVTSGRHPSRSSAKAWSLAWATVMYRAVRDKPTPVGNVCKYRVLVLIRSLFWYCFDTAAASLFQFSQYTCLGSDVWRDNIMFRARPEARSQWYRWIIFKSSATIPIRSMSGRFNLTCHETRHTRAGSCKSCAQQLGNFMRALVKRFT